MDEVADGLFVGTVEDAGDEALIREHNIAIIVSLTHSDPDGRFPSDLIVKNVPVMDGPRNDQQKFERAVTHVLSGLKTGDNTLVHCSAGPSRSPAVAATALALYEHVELEAAFEQVAKRRNLVDPHEALVRQAARVFSQYRE
ncbi:Dual specificity phosphatase, catalytic domain [Halovenus aranensis]|uniref:Dual specificity phosphatase, catalytic domain n=1 Tax=Halovenus aranensis TaxID=890420 RepID=A0A1G8ZGN2_9EURY|nr:dual specificity protein phosphatase [Halovenus aranensis]SDK14143.1 Dual specificity phosphatase, catalytic domain [Halovenus aranensis]